MFVLPIAAASLSPSPFSSWQIKVLRNVVRVAPISKVEFANMFEIMSRIDCRRILWVDCEDNAAGVRTLIEEGPSERHGRKDGVIEGDFAFYIFQFAASCLSRSRRRPFLSFPPYPKIAITVAPGMVVRAANRKRE